MRRMLKIDLMTLKTPTLKVGLLLLAVLGSTLQGVARGQDTRFMPDPVRDDCGLQVQIDQVGEVRTGNLASPVSVGNDLYLIDQKRGILYRDEGAVGNPVEVFNVDNDLPEGLRLFIPRLKSEFIVNISPGRHVDEIYIVFTSETIPEGTPNVFERANYREGHSRSLLTGRGPASRPVNLYSIGALQWVVPSLYCCLARPWNLILNPTYQIMYSMNVTRSTEGDETLVRLTNPVPLASFPIQEGPTHHGGAMATLPDGRLLYATADALPFGTNGLEPCQDDASPYCKIFLVDPSAEGGPSVTMLAKGLRNTQHMELVPVRTMLGDTNLRLVTGELGGVTAEEINVIRIDELLDTSKIENLGWGISEDDGLAREGTFYVARGIAGATETPRAVGRVNVTEERERFLQPHAMYGRDFDRFLSFWAMSGPVISFESFRTIKALWSDLISGFVMATVGDNNLMDMANFYNELEEVCYVDVVDGETGVAYKSFNYYVKGADRERAVRQRYVNRLDPRFFRFPDGTAGVLFEKTGRYYRLTQL